MHLRPLVYFFYSFLYFININKYLQIDYVLATTTTQLDMSATTTLSQCVPPQQCQLYMMMAGLETCMCLKPQIYFFYSFLYSTHIIYI